MTTRLRPHINARNLLLAALLLAWALFLRPQALGGSAAFILVRGDSMLPTFNNGDLLLVYPQASYSVGDIVAYRLPASEVGAGHLVVHRISATSPDGFELQGDNNPVADPWTARPADVAGRVFLRIPAVGMVLAFLLQPVLAGGLASAGVVMFILARATRTTASRPPKARPVPVAEQGARATRLGS